MLSCGFPIRKILAFGKTAYVQYKKTQLSRADMIHSLEN